MAKKKSPRATTTNALPAVDPKVKEIIRNGLEGAIMGFNPGFSGGQISQTETLFDNLRFYMVSNMRQPLSQAYVEIGLVQNVIDVPVDDGLRGGITFKSKQLSPEELEELHIYFDQEGIMPFVVGQALKWNRLFGGAGILILSDQDPGSPFDVSQISEDSPLEFRAVDMWELFYDKQNVEGFNPAIDEPAFDFYNYYGLKVHKSRVMKMKGLVAPSFVRPRLRGWGFSVIEALIRSINQYLKSNRLSFELLDEAKVDFYKIKNLANTLMTAAGQEATTKRVALANWQKNYQNAVTMDSEDEWDQKVLNFAGLSDMLKEIRIQVASDLRMPMTKLFGISASGLANSNEDDIENYNAMVESQVREKCKYDIIRIAEICCQKLFGYVPDDLQGEFKSLRVLSGVDEQTVMTSKFARLLQAKQAGLMTTKEFKDACNKDGLLSIQLDTSIEVITPETDDGPNREDSRQASPADQNPKDGGTSE